jgi:hypothetical protein
MTMSTWNWKRTGSGLIAGAAAALMIGASVAAPALAATPTWSVHPGGKVTGAAKKTVLTDTKSHLPLSCATSTTVATIKKGTKLSGAGLGLITSVVFKNCTGPAALKFSVATSATAKKPWKLNAVSYNKKTGVTTGTITGIHAKLTGAECTAVVDGTGATKDNGMVKATYTNKTHKLVILAAGGNLHIYDANCLGIINNKDGSSFTGTYLITPGQTITSP